MARTVMHDRTAWERKGDGPRYLKGRNYSTLIEFSRPCKTCGEPFSIYVTKKIADGTANSNNFALVNCETHRRGSGSVEVDALRSKTSVMSEEMQGLYGIERELRGEVTSMLSRIKALEAENARLKNKSKKLPWEA